MTTVRRYLFGAERQAVTYRFTAAAMGTRTGGRSVGAVGSRGNKVVRIPEAKRAGSNMKILIIDDDPKICSLCQNLLGRDGYQVDALTDPTLAVEQFKKERYQIVILDLGFPVNDQGVDGKRLMEEFLHIDSDVCIIILTGHPTIEDIIATLGNYKAFDFLTKPISVEKLKEVIEKAIEQHGIPVDPVQEISAEVGRRIRQVRKEKNLTMRQLSNRIGLSTSLISQIERGESSPSIPTLYKISVALKLPLSRLFDGY